MGIKRQVCRTRRNFIGAALGGAAAMALVGCGDDDTVAGDAGLADGGSPPTDAGAPDLHLDGGAPACADPFAGGTFQEAVPFANEGSVPTNTLLKEGLDGRLYTDLSDLGQTSLITPTERFFVRTRRPDLMDTSKPWSVVVDGLVKTPTSLSMSDLKPQISDMGTYLLECSGNSRGGHFGLMGAATWSGVPLAKVLSKISPGAKATRLLVGGFDKHSKPSANGHSTPGASWIFTLDQLSGQGAFLATHMNGKPLTPDHGFPVRLVVPRWYGCTNIKWVDRLTLVDDTAPATSQMKEFASRTHQQGVPTMARDYIPAAMGLSATPVRVERWTLADKSTAYRVVGVVWGGSAPTKRLQIRLGDHRPYEPVTLCPKMTTNDTWTLWIHRWVPKQKGTHELRLRVDDPKVKTLRLDAGWYRRYVTIKHL